MADETKRSLDDCKVHALSHRAHPCRDRGDDLWAPSKKFRRETREDSRTGPDDTYAALECRELGGDFACLGQFGAYLLHDPDRGWKKNWVSFRWFSFDTALREARAHADFSLVGGCPDFPVSKKPSETGRTSRREARLSPRCIIVGSIQDFREFLEIGAGPNGKEPSMLRIRSLCHPPAGGGCRVGGRSRVNSSRGASTSDDGREARTEMPEEPGQRESRNELDWRSRISCCGR
jgi:hypothetical protein